MFAGHSAALFALLAGVSPAFSSGGRTPRTNTPPALLLGLGSSMAVLGAFLLLARGLGKWLLPLTAMGSMTLTPLSAHLLALSTEIHYDQR